MNPDLRTAGAVVADISNREVAPALPEEGGEIFPIAVACLEDIGVAEVKALPVDGMEAGGVAAVVDDPGGVGADAGRGDAGNFDQLRMVDSGGFD